MNYKLYFQFLNSTSLIFNGFTVLKNYYDQEAVIEKGKTTGTNLSVITGGANGDHLTHASGFGANLIISYDSSAPFNNKVTYTLFSTNTIPQNVYFNIINPGNSTIDTLPTNNSYFVGVFLKHDSQDLSLDYVPINIIGWDTTANSDISLQGSVISNANLCFYSVYVTRSWKYYVFEKFRNNTLSDTSLTTPMFKIVLAEAYVNKKIKLLVNGPVLSIVKEYDFFHNQLEVLHVKSRQDRCVSIIYDQKKQFLGNTFDCTVGTKSFAYNVNSQVFCSLKYNDFYKQDCIEITLPRGTATTNVFFYELGRLRNYTSLVGKILVFRFAARSSDGGNVELVHVNSIMEIFTLTTNWQEYLYEQPANQNIGANSFLSNITYLRIRNQSTPLNTTAFVANFQIFIKNERSITNLVLEQSKSGISHSSGSMYLHDFPQYLEFSSEEAVFAKNDVKTTGFITFTELN